MVSIPFVKYVIFFTIVQIIISDAKLYISANGIVYICQNINFNDVSQFVVFRAILCFYRFFLKKSFTRALHSSASIPPVTLVRGCRTEEVSKEYPSLVSVAP